METPTTILNGIKFKQKLDEVSNNGEIELFLHLQAISITGIWQMDSFYVGAEDLKHYKDKKFGALMHDIYNKSTTWFGNMDLFLTRDNWRELYLKHGHENMVAYKAFSLEHREFVLKVAAKRPSANFHAILRSAGMKGGYTPDIQKEKELAWQKKYIKLEKRFNTLKTKHTAVKKENKNLIKKLNRIEGLFSKTNK